MGMNLPSDEAVRRLLDEFNVPEHIRKHSGQVKKIAVFLGKKLAERGVPVNLELVEKGALLHDLAKMQSIGGDEVGHSERGGEILAAKGFPELGRVVGNHGLGKILRPYGAFELEDKLVYYADKRVNHDEIVSLAERFAYLKERYGSKSPAIMADILECEKPCLAIEKEILNKAKTDSSLTGLR